MKHISRSVCDGEDHLARVLVSKPGTAVACFYPSPIESFCAPGAG